MNWKKRSQELELLDLGPSHYSEEEHKECVRQLDRIGKYLGGDAATFHAIEQLHTPPSSILEVGCGGGLFAIKLAEKYPEAEILGIDISLQMINTAKENLQHRSIKLHNIRFELLEEPELHYPDKSFDVVCATLVCHHLSDEALINFIKRASRIAKKEVILNDLHRHPIAFWTFKAAAPLFFPNRLVQHDGPISIQRGFTREEWASYLNRAGIPEKDYIISWCWAFRWLITIHTTSIL